jgi:Holliday junction resolvase RusA-like endonuclease
MKKKNATTKKAQPNREATAGEELVVRVRKRSLIQFQFEGEIVGKGRPRFAGTRQHDTAKGKRGSPIMRTPQKTKSVEETIKWLAYNAAVEAKMKRASGDLRLEVVVFNRIPPSYSQARAQNCELGIERPHAVPDGDNILKLISDSFNKHIYDDDRRVVEGEFVKWFVPDRAMEPYTVIELYQLYTLPPTSKSQVYRELSEAMGRWVVMPEAERAQLYDQHFGLFLDVGDALQALPR